MTPPSSRRFPCVLTFDVEDWFQTENLRALFPHRGWEAIPQRVVGGTERVLDFLDRHGIPATFFVLGWVAERQPSLVKDIQQRGHEVACHGLRHVLPTRIGLTEFCDDAQRAREILEHITGRPVTGYRAPSFAVTDDHLAVLPECGFSYDSSVNPFALHDRYGRVRTLGNPVSPGLYRVHGVLNEIALPVTHVGPVPVPIGGGGYFRLYPPSLFRFLVRGFVRRHGFYAMYLHSWEFDPDQPRVTAPGFGRTFRHYHALRQVEPRLHRLVAMLRESGAEFLTASDFVDKAVVA